MYQKYNVVTRYICLYTRNLKYMNRDRGGEGLVGSLKSQLHTPTNKI